MGQTISPLPFRPVAAAAAAVLPVVAVAAALLQLLLPAVLSFRPLLVKGATIGRKRRARLGTPVEEEEIRA